MTDVTKLSGSKLSALAKAIDEFRKIDSEMPIQQAAVFVEVAIRGAITMKDLGEALGLAQSSISRSVAALGKWHRLNKPGHDLLSAEEDPAERRRKIVRLTPKGVRVAKSLGDLINN